MSSQRTDEKSDLQVEVSETSAVVRTLEVEVSADRVRRAFDRAYREIGRTGQVRGFRKGKVPRSVLEKLYGAALVDDVGRALVSETIRDAMELAEVTPVTEPEIETHALSSDQAFGYTARIEIKPAIELPELIGLPAVLPAVELSDEEVEGELENLRQRKAPLLEEDPEIAAAVGHHVEVDFVGRIDGEPFEGCHGEGVVIEIGAKRMIPGFEEQLVGARAGENREVRVTFSEDYQAEKLRGREAVFSVQLKTIRHRELPALDDEFAKDVGPFESIDQLRERIRSELLATRQRQAQAALHRSLLDALVERTSFEVPVGLVERRLQGQLASMQRQLEGQVPAESLQAQLTRMQEEGRPAVERRVRESLLLEAVAESQSLSASDEDVDARLQEMAEEQGVDVAQLRKLALEQAWHDAIRVELVDRKALDFLASEAKVEETTDT
ncbi:MAG: trigger factor [Myxococcota bacterium]